MKDRFYTDWNDVFIMFYPGQAGSLIAAILTLFSKDFYHHDIESIKKRDKWDNHFDLNVLENFLHRTSNRQIFYSTGNSLYRHSNQKLLKKYIKEAKGKNIAHRVMAKSIEDFDRDLLKNNRVITITLDTTQDYSIMCNQALMKVASIGDYATDRRYNKYLKDREMSNELRKLHWTLNALERAQKTKKTLDDYVLKNNALPIRLNDVFFEFEKVLDCLSSVYEIDKEPARNYYKKWRNRQELIETEYWETAVKLFRKSHRTPFELKKS